MFAMKPEVEIWPRVGIETPTSPTQVTGSRKNVGPHGNWFATYDFLFDFNRHYGYILNRLAGNKLLPVYTSSLWQIEVVLRRQQRSLEWLRGHQRSNTKPPQVKNGLQRALAAKPEVEIWPRVSCFRFVGERTYLSMVSEKNRTDIFRNGRDIEGQTWSLGPKRHCVQKF